MVVSVWLRVDCAALNYMHNSISSSINVERDKMSDFSPLFFFIFKKINVIG